MLLLTTSGLALRVGALFISSAHISESYAVSGAIFYLLCYNIFSHNAGMDIKRSLLVIGRASGHLLGWATLGLIFRYALSLFP